MSRAQQNKIIQQLVDRIHEGYQPQKIILFGSYAYGQPREHSDVDLAVIKNTRKSFHERNVEARLLVADSEMPLDIFVFTPKEFEQKQTTNPLLEEIATRGKLMYAKTKVS
jgi:predicted nucleotidyltransferase